MSRSQPTPINPAKRFFKWSGNDGKLVYYDKEKAVEVEVALPFEFLVLDQLATMAGFCEPDSSSYWSNEVKFIKSDQLVVRTSKGIKETGKYEDLTDVRSKGAKYAKSIYIAYLEGDQYVIGNIKAYGAALTAWIDLSGRYNVEKGKVSLTGSTEGKKGSNTYCIPTFEWQASETLEDETAERLDKELQVYLSQYLNAAKPYTDPDGDMESLIAGGEPVTDEDPFIEEE